VGFYVTLDIPATKEVFGASIGGDSEKEVFKEHNVPTGLCVIKSVSLKSKYLVILSE
jgi:hypothetical protein